MLNPQPLPPSGGDDGKGKAGSRHRGNSADSVMLNPQPLPPGGGDDSKGKAGFRPGGLPARGVGATSLGPKQDDPGPPPSPDSKSLGGGISK